MKQIISILTCMMLISIGLSNICPAELSNVTIYVDDDNINGPWEGTLEYPFQHIQDAIDAASDGDIVFVYNGYYQENVKITEKSIELIGEDKENTVIAGDNVKSTIIMCYCNGSKIDGFTVESQPDDFYVYNGIHVYQCNNIRISNIVAVQKGCRWGIWISNVDDSTISDNILGNKSKGIEIDSSDNNIISRNIIENNDEEDASIYIEDSDYNIVIANIISNNKNPGIKLIGSSSNIIQGNDIRNNKYGIYLRRSAGNDIFKNNIVDNEIHDGFFVDAFFNMWHRNYYGHVLFKIIYGVKLIYYDTHPGGVAIPILKVEWLPRRMPYII